MQIIKQSTAITAKIGPFLDESDGKTAETGLTIAQADVKLSKNGGAMAQKNDATSCTHDALGVYGCPLNTTDTSTLGRLQLWVHESGALPVWHEYMVVPANVYDSLFSTDKLQVDVTQIGGVAQSATDLKDFADAGYDPATNKVQGVVLVDTTTTNTDMVDISSLALEATLTAIKGTGFDTATDSLVKLHDDHASHLDQAISTTESNIRGGTETLETLKSAIGGIQNNTRFTAAVPSYMCKPDAGNEAFKHSGNLYDTDGNMEDPLNSEVLVRIVKDDGTFITANLYKENALSTALDNATNTTDFPVASGWRAMERTATGRYFFFYKVASDETEESLTVEFGWEETTDVFTYQSRSTEISDVHGDLTAILTDTAAIKAKTDNLPSDPADQSLLVVEHDTTQAAIAALNDISTVEVNTEVDNALDTAISSPTSGSLLDFAERIMKISKNKWKIVSNQLILYDNDGSTPLYTFNLKDSAGDPASENVYERVPA